MGHRNEGNVRRVATVLLANATPKHGLTLDELSDQCGLHRTTINRIVLKEPGFGKAIEPSWPHSYYYSHSLAQHKMNLKAEVNARLDPRGEKIITTTLGNAVFPEVGHFPSGKEAQYLTELKNLGGKLNALGVDPLSGGGFVNDIELQKKWFAEFVKTLNACRIVYEFGTDILSSDEFQQPDFWKIFITTNQD